jgi:hypothetical protein
MLDTIKAFFNRVWVWCRESATIVAARIMSIGGVVTAGLIVAFANFDFTQLTRMTPSDAIKMLLSVAVAGVVAEIARRRTLPPK